jgi:serine/threonine protein phosphatase PrpC
MNYNQDTQRELMKTNFNRRDSSEQRSDLIYKNFFNNNNYNNIQDERQRSYPYGFKRTPDKINLLKVNNVENYNYSAQKEEHPINKINRGYSLENIHNKYNRNSNNYKQSFKIVDYGYHTLAGTNQYYIPKTNQDSYLIKADKINSGEIEYTFGVFDGHGLQGHFVSQAIKQFLTNCSYFDFNTQPMILSVFSSLSNNINNSKYFDSMDSGSTVILVHINSKKIISINCGDSRAILITKRNNSNYLNRRANNIIELSRDHKPDLPEEKMRIERSGGRVDKIFGMGPYRVWFKNEDFPGLAMSRSIGDKLAHRVGVSDIPEIKEFNIEENSPLAIVLASDGVWEFMSNEEVSDIVYRFEDNKDASICAKKIVERARQTWEKTGYAIDDITCVVVFFKEI